MTSADAPAVGLYADPLVYDVLHAEDTAADAALVLRLARRHGAAGRAHPVAFEPACGTGRYLLALARRGCRVLGVDLAPEMVAFARARFAAERGRRPAGASGRFLVGDMTRMDGFARPASIDLAFCPINSVRHLETDDAMLAHLRGVRAALRPSGVYVVGLSVSLYGMESPSEDVWEGRRGSLHVRQVVQYIPPEGRGGGDRFEHVHSQLVITRGRGARARIEHRGSSYRLRCFSRREWERAVADAGLGVLGVYDQHGRAMGRPELGYGLWVLGPGR